MLSPKRISYPFVLFHIIALLGIYFYPPTWKFVAIAIGTYFFKTFFITGGYHRYFSHHAFKMNRFWQFIFAFFGGANAQKSALWWAAGHRYHHKYSDKPGDIHSPHQDLLFCHGGWVLVKRHMEVKEEFIPDLLKFPELVWLHKHQVVPVLFWFCLMFIFWGMPGVVWGGLVSSLMNWHGTFLINSLGHLWGTQDYESNDESRNNFFLAILTMGDGWHNNHHAQSYTASHGFAWWQFDSTYVILLILEKLHIVSDLKQPNYQTLVPKKNKSK